MAPVLHHRIARYFDSLGKFRFADARSDINLPLPNVWSPQNKLSILLNVDSRQVRQVPRRSRQGKLLRMSRRMFWQQISVPLALFAECERIYYGMYYVAKLEDEVLHDKYLEVRERLSAVVDCLGMNVVTGTEENGDGGDGSETEDKEGKDSKGNKDSKWGKVMSPAHVGMGKGSPARDNATKKTSKDAMLSPPSAIRTSSSLPFRDATTPKSHRRYRSNSRSSSSSSSTAASVDGIDGTEGGNSACLFPPRTFVSLVYNLSVLVQLRISMIATYKTLKHHQRTPSYLKYDELANATSTLSRKAGEMRGVARVVGVVEENASSLENDIMSSIIGHTKYESLILHECLKCQDTVSHWQFVKTTKHLHRIRKTVKKWRLQCNAECSGIEPPCLMWLESFHGVLMAKANVYYQSFHEKMRRARKIRKRGEEVTKIEGGVEKRKEERNGNEGRQAAETKMNNSAPSLSMSEYGKGDIGSTKPENSPLKLYHIHSDMNSKNNNERSGADIQEVETSNRPSSTLLDTTLRRVERMVKQMVDAGTDRGLKTFAVIVLELRHPGGSTGAGNMYDPAYGYTTQYNIPRQMPSMGGEEKSKSEVAAATAAAAVAAAARTTSSRRRKTPLDATMARHLLEAKRRRNEEYVGIRSSPIVYIYPPTFSESLSSLPLSAMLPHYYYYQQQQQHQRQYQHQHQHQHQHAPQDNVIVAPIHLPNLASLAMSAESDEPVTHVYVPPPKNKNTTTTTAMPMVMKTNRIQEQNQKKMRSVTEASIGMISEQKKQTISSLSSLSSRSMYNTPKERKTTDVLRSGKETGTLSKKIFSNSTVSASVPTLDMSMLGVHYYCVRIEKTMSLLVVEIPMENENNGTAVSALEQAEQGGESTGSKGNGNGAESTDGTLAVKTKTGVGKDQDQDGREAVEESKRHVIVSGNESQPPSVSVSTSSTSASTPSSAVAPIFTAPPTSESFPCTSADGPPSPTAPLYRTSNTPVAPLNAMAVGTSSSMWYSSSGAQRRSALLKSAQQRQQQTQERAGRLEALKKANAKIVSKMQSIADILQHRTLLEQLGPTAASTVEQRQQIEEQHEFRQSLLSRTDAEDEGKLQRGGCIVL